MHPARIILLCTLSPLIALRAGESPAPSPATPAPPVPDPAAPLLRQAAQHSPLLLEQELRVAQTDAFRFRGWRQYMPYITANYQAGLFNLLSTPAANSAEGENKFGGSYTLSAYHPIYHWGAIEAEKKSAFARENLSRAEALIAWRKLVSDLRPKFHDAVLAKARVALLELRVQAASRALDSADQELRLGRIVETERAARLLELRNRELELNRLKIELASLLAQLRSLSGAETLGVNDLPDDLPDLEWDDDALAERLDEFRRLGLDDTPEHRRARHACDMYENQRVMAQSRELPTFNLGASVNQSPVENNGRFGMQTYVFAGVMGTWNIFDRQTTLENVRSLRIASRLVETNLAFDNRRRITELENATLRLKASRLARDLRRDIVKLRHDAFEAVRQRSRLGLAAREELASAEEALLAARLDLLRDRAGILNAYHAFMSGILLDPVDQLYTAPSNER